jgi:hypothetical protein
MMTIKVSGGETEWRVEVGDKKTYIYTKFKRLDESEATIYVKKSMTEMEKISVKKETKYSVEIIELNEGAKIKINYKEFKTDNLGGDGFVMRIVKDKNELEEEAKKDENITFDGKFLTIRNSSVDFLDFNTTKIIKWMVETGWLEYSYFLVCSSPTCISHEIEIMSSESIDRELDPLIILVIIPAIVLGLVILFMEWNKTKVKRKIENYEKNYDLSPFYQKNKI